MRLILLRCHALAADPQKSPRLARVLSALDEAIVVPSQPALSAMICQRRKVHTLPKRVRLGVAKHDDVLRIERDDKLAAVALKRHYGWQSVKRHRAARSMS